MGTDISRSIFKWLGKDSGVVRPEGKEDGTREEKEEKEMGRGGGAESGGGGGIDKESEGNV